MSATNRVYGIREDQHERWGKERDSHENFYLWCACSSLWGGEEGDDSEVLGKILWAEKVALGNDFVVGLLSCVCVQLIIIDCYLHINLTTN